MTDADDKAALLARWWDELCTGLGLEDVPADADRLLTLAGVAAHEVVRPAAPLTTFLVGYAAGLAGGTGAAVDDAVARATAAARSHAASDS